ncbi:MAG: LysR family transcriptional regulator [Eggerthellaceae bacterium]|nr:LysR family transcriptional regulator [Eggerthellaceae bacterium]MCH4220985.1 LysR family transcriptional regulator [Eggerthellaceae bacterium]
MNLTHLAYYVAAVENESFTAAAASVNVTAQAVSRAVSDLEEEIQVPLFIRSGKQLKQTEFSRVFYEKVMDVLDSVADLHTIAVQYRAHDESSGQLRVGLATAMYRGIGLGEAELEEFKVEHPDIELKVFSNTGNSCLVALEDDLLDVVVNIGRVHRPKITSCKLYETHIRLALGLMHPLANHRVVRLADLDGVNIASFSDLGFFYKRFSELCEIEKCEPKFVNLPPEPDAYRTFVESGDGAVFVSDEPIVSDYYRHAVFLEVDSITTLSIPVCLVYKQDCSNVAIEPLKKYLTLKTLERRQEHIVYNML